MKKIIFALSALFFIHYSCSNPNRKTTNENLSENLSELTVDNFSEQIRDFVGKEVMISGRVTHVCRHGGQRLFITGIDSSKTIRITTGENIPEFDISLEGSMIGVNGIVKELIIDETYLAEWEAEVTEGTSKEQKGHQDGLDEHQKQQVETGSGDALASIQDLRDEIAASGKDHLSDYWIETIELKVIE